MVWWLAPLAHSKRVPGSIPRWGLSVWSLHVFPMYAWVLSGYSGFLPLPKYMHARLIGDYKLSSGVRVSVHGCCDGLSRVWPASRLCDPRYRRWMLWYYWIDYWLIYEICRSLHPALNFISHNSLEFGEIFIIIRLLYSLIPFTNKEKSVAKSEQSDFFPAVNSRNVYRTTLIYFLYLQHPFQGHREAGIYPSCHGARCRVHPGHHSPSKTVRKY